MRRLTILLTALVTLVVGVPGTAQAAPAYPTYVGSVGDSITRGFDATLWGCFLSDCPAYSWSTGTSSSVPSHLRRIRAAQPGVTVTAWNAARTGAKVAELDVQLAALDARVQYVTVLIGANDVCTSSPTTMTSVDSFRTEFTTAVDGYLRAHSNARIFVSSIPNVYQLWSLFRSSSSAQSTWRTFGICQSMLSSSNTETQRQTVLTREKAFNSIMAQVCAAWAAQCKWDQGATFDHLFVKSDVSTVDYFHPSVSGQGTLANITWPKSWWAA
jgi:lysophospholipase L1-like esterase